MRCLVPWLKVFGKVHKVTPCSMYMIAHDIVQHSSDCDSNELDEASRSVRMFYVINVGGSMMSALEGLAQSGESGKCRNRIVTL